MSNQASLFGAQKVNGYNLVSGQNFFRDVSPNYIVAVMPCNIKNAEGQLVPCFQILYQSPMQLTLDTYYLLQHVGLTSLANFKTALETISATNKFTIYPNLVKTSDWAQSMVPASTSVMLNDIYYYRDYVQPKNWTVVTVNIGPRLVKTQYFFTGDQTIAGHYYYLYSWGSGSL